MSVLTSSSSWWLLSHLFWSENQGWETKWQAEVSFFIMHFKKKVLRIKLTSPELLWVFLLIIWSFWPHTDSDTVFMIWKRNNVFVTEADSELQLQHFIYTSYFVEAVRCRLRRSTLITKGRVYCPRFFCSWSVRGIKLLLSVAPLRWPCWHSPYVSQQFSLSSSSSCVYFESCERTCHLSTPSGLTLRSVPQGPATGMSLGSLSGKRGGNEQHAAWITVGVWTSILFHFVHFGFWDLTFDRGFFLCWWLVAQDCIWDDSSSINALPEVFAVQGVLSSLLFLTFILWFGHVSTNSTKTNK